MTNPGDPLVIRANEWRRIRSAARAAEFAPIPRSRDPDAMLGLSQTQALVHNVHTVTIPRYGGVALLNAIFDPAVAGQHGEWSKRVVLEGRNSVAAESTSWVGVAMRDITQNHMGRVCIGGVCHAQVNMLDSGHRFATIAEAGTALESTSRGPISILAVASGTGLKYAIVWVGPPGGSATPDSLFARITSADLQGGQDNRWWYSWVEVEWDPETEEWTDVSGGLTGGPGVGFGPAVNSVEDNNDGEDRESAGVDLNSDVATVTLLPIGMGGTDPVYRLTLAHQGGGDTTNVWQFEEGNDVDVDCEDPLAAAEPIRHSDFSALGGLIVGVGPDDALELLPGADHTVLSADSTATEGLAYVYRHRLVAPPLTADGTAVTNTTTETSISSIAIGAAMDAVGGCLRITFAGDIQSTGSSVSCTLRLKLGGVTIRTWTFTFATTTGGAAGWHASALITTRAAGATGNVHVSDVGGGVLRTMLQLGAGATSGSIDLTDGGTTLALTAQWSAASTNHSVQVEQVLAEGLNL